MVQAYHGLDQQLREVEHEIRERAMALALETKKREIELRDSERDVRRMEGEIEATRRSIAVMRQLHDEDVKNLEH
jgi:predicted DNA binding CopG/RHH family protein